MKTKNNNPFQDSLFNNTHMDFLDTSAESVTEEEILDYLARIIASIYLKDNHPINLPKEDGDYLF